IPARRQAGERNLRRVPVAARRALQLLAAPLVRRREDRLPIVGQDRGGDADAVRRGSEVVVDLREDRELVVACEVTSRRRWRRQDILELVDRRIRTRG